MTRVDDVAQELGLGVDGCLQGGEHGAVAVRDAAGRELVLKIFPLEKLALISEGAAIANTLRGRGVGVPDPYRAAATDTSAYSLQGRVCGNIPAPLTPTHARTLTAWWEKQMGACPKGGDWPEAVGRALARGEPALWAEHGPIRDAAAAEEHEGTGIVARAALQLLDEIVAVGESYRPDLMVRDDAVHTDFHHANVLVSGDELCAVIDWDAARAGDARYDLVILTFWAGVQRGLQVDAAAADHIASFSHEHVPDMVRVHLAALYALHQLWFCTVHRPQYLERMIGHIAEHLRPYWTQ